MKTMKSTQFLLGPGVFVAILLIHPLMGSALSAQPINKQNADAQTPAAIEGNIDDVARAILTYFPKVTGTIVSLEEKEIKIDLGGKQRLSKGTLLTVFRKEEHFHHSVTNVPLGQFEKELGTLEVEHFKSPHLLTRSITPDSEIQAGDLVRITATRIPLAVSLSSDTGHSFLMHELISALTDTGRFKITSLSPGVDLNTAKKDGNHYHIQLATSRKEDRFSMDLQIQNTFTGTVLAKLSILIQQSEESDLILEHLQFQLFEQRQKK